jgi:heme ABC exporter ATP-binding subunit CcmA
MRRAELAVDLAPGQRQRELTPPAVRLEGVAHRFGERWVLRGCTLTALPGEAIALLGSNGAGKTTLLKIVSTLLRPSRGTASVYGHDVVVDADSVRGSIGFLGHSPALYDDLTAAEHLRFASRMRGERPDAAAIARVLERVGLLHHADTRVRAFSSGMRRRVALGRIVLHPPRLLLLDEPYASFDEEGIELTNELVREVAGAGGTVLAATHDLPRAAAVTTAAYRIHDGLLEEIELPARNGAAPDLHRGLPPRVGNGNGRPG